MFEMYFANCNLRSSPEQNKTAVCVSPLSRLWQAGYRFSNTVRSTPWNYVNCITEKCLSFVE